MSSTEVVHIISHVFITLIFLNAFIGSIGMFLLANAYSYEDVRFIQSIFIDPATMGMAFFVLITFIWSIYFIFSYFKTNIENKYFKISAWMNVIGSILLLLFTIAMPFLAWASTIDPVYLIWAIVLLALIFRNLE